jgi:two-component system CheB/CheR fusion protein
VEDNADTRTLLGEGLAGLGYQVQTAGTGEEALDLLDRQRPDVILSDIGLPGISGYEFLRLARQRPGLDRVTAFAVTGFGQDEDVRHAGDAGFSGHFTKPIDIGTLDRRIRDQVRRGGSTPEPTA